MINSQVFKDKIKREPLFSLNNLRLIPDNKEAFDAFADSLYNNVKFRDAIFLSSPELFHEWEKVMQGKERGTVSLSIIKFFLRSISNTVPFGLFAAYSVSDASAAGDAGAVDGGVSDAGAAAASAGEFTRFSDIDSDYLIKLIARLNEHPAVKKIVRFRTNNTLYRVGDKYRYIEPSVVNNKLNYTLTSIEYNEVVELVLNVNKSEMSFDELITILLDAVEGLDEEMAIGFIDELIGSRILLSSLELALNEGNLLDQVIANLAAGGVAVTEDEYLSTVLVALTEVRSRLLALDAQVFNDNAVYYPIFAALERIGVAFDKKLIVNSNLRRNGVNFEDLDDKVQKLIGVLDKVSPSRASIVNDNLVKFRERFQRRYEDSELPLLEVLDNELGIGYLADLEEHFVFSDLTDNIELPMKKSEQRKITITPDVYQFWQQCLLTESKEIDLEKKDLSCFKGDNESFGTFSVMFSYANNVLSLKNVGNASATNLLGRFSSKDVAVGNLLNELAEIEAGYFKQEELAEIIHLPNNRTANVTIRNIRRKSEISILSKNSSHAQNIPLADLLVSVRGDKIILRSKSTGKEILPFLTSAQNYSFDSLPVYQFLCDLQGQSRKNIFMINFGGLRVSMIDYFPRIVYGKDIILRKATWRLRKSEILSIKAGKAGAKVTADLLREHVQKLALPKYVYFTEGNEDKMIIDTENKHVLEILVQEINKKEAVEVVECIYDITGEESYANEYIYSCVSKNQAPGRGIGAGGQQGVKRQFVLGDEWVYFKLYTGRVTADSILINNLAPMVEELLGAKQIDKWFFLRYSDPDFHLRVRLHVSDIEHIGPVIGRINAYFRGLLEEGKVWKMEFATYNRELERYFWDNIQRSETLFFYDSAFSLSLMRKLKEHRQSDKVWLYLLRSVDEFFDAFGIGLAEKHDIITRMFNSFWNEFGADKGVKQQISKKYRLYYPEMERVFNELPPDLEEIYRKRANKLATLVFDGFDRNQITSLLWSYIHMNVNRLIRANPRFHELAIYGLLEKQYSRKVGLAKQAAQGSPVENEVV